MATFVYAPGIRVYIDTERHGTIDISNDLVDYTLQRRSDGPSTLNFSLQNIKRKYDGVFTPNDRIIVELKRVTWVRVFTGLLNSVPLITAWPRVVALSASCSLKRLQYWYWDPQLASSFQTVMQAVGDGINTADAGISNAIRTLLKEVVGWPENKVHIGAIPPNWFQLILPYARALVDQIEESDTYVTNLLGATGYGSVGGSYVGGPSGVVASGVFKSPKVYKGETFSVGQLLNAEIIIRVGKSMGLGKNVLYAALIAACGESRLIASAANPTSSARGLFQQLATWGTEADRLNPVEASKKFFNAAKNTKGYQTLSASLLAADVQGYRYGSGQYTSYEIQAPLHDKYLALAEELVREYELSANTGATSPSSDGTTTTIANQVVTDLDTASGTKPGANQFVAMAHDLVTRYPHVPYGATTLAQIKGPGQPRQVGCSGFVSWVLMSKFGKLPSGWPLQWAAGQYEWCKDHGGKTMSIDEALKTQGVLLVRFPTDNVGHIEITVGDGKRTFAATSVRDPAGYREYGLDYYRDNFDAAITMPWFDYTNAKNGVPPMVDSLAGGGTGAATVPYSSTAAYQGDNPIDKLFGSTLVTEDNIDSVLSQTLASAFSGPRALLNDQPLLPYIKNLVNASLRSFCSAPNGDFMAWFPDYYGLWGSAAIMQIEPIELLDFYVEWSDDFMVTHQYAVAGTTNYLDGFSGTVSTAFGEGRGTDPLSDSRIHTAGVASIDIPAIMFALFGINVTDEQAETYREFVYRKFGARPDFKQMDGLVGKAAEIFSAMYYFMRQWAYQYNANVPVTFMPELWPGMLIQIPEYKFQAYVTAVTHSGQMGEGGGHSTSINVAAPARLEGSVKKGKQNLIGLPVASGMLHLTTENVTSTITDPEADLTFTPKNHFQAEEGR
jgi:hypothetical protein